MSSNPPSKHSYWLETAIHSALGPPPQLRPKSRLCSVLQTLGISKKPTSVALTVFSGVSNTRVIISGLDWAGKTTLLRNQISLDSTRTGKDIETCAPFIGMLIKTLSYPSSGIIFHAIDIGGAASSSYRQLECAVCAKADAVIWVVDAGDRDRLAESKEEFLRFLNAVAKSEREYLRGEVMVQKVPVVILANKQDLEGAMNVETIKDAFNCVTETFGNCAWGIYGTETESGNGVSEALGWLAGQLRAKESSLVTESHNVLSDLGAVRVGNNQAGLTA